MSKAVFAKAPLTEVICGVTFNAPEFSSVHFGLYWQHIKAQYPGLPKDTHPIGEVPLLSIPPKLRRVWFESLDTHKVLQLQADKFLFNWRKLETESKYPHFQEVYQEFEQEWQRFQTWWDDFSKENPRESPSPFDRLEVVQYELTYLNQISEALGWQSVADSPAIFNFLGGWKDFPLGNPQTQNVNLEFALPDHLGTLSLVVGQAIKLEDNSPMLTCEITARSGFELDRSPRQWFEETHELVVKSFMHLLQDQIKQAWGFQWLEQ